MPERFKPLIRLIRRMRIPWLLLGAACLLTLIETAGALWVPILTRDLVNSAGAPAGIPGALLATLVVVLLGQAAVSGLGLYILSRAGEQMTAFLRNLLFEHLIRLPMCFHDDRESGDLVSRTISDTTSVKSLLTEQAIAFIASVVAMVGAIVILWFLDWRLTLVLFSSVVAGLLLILPVVARLQAVGREIQSKQARLSGRLTNILGEIRLVKASCAEDEERRSAHTLIDALRKLGLSQAKVLTVLGPVMTLAMTGALVVILGYGGSRVGSGVLEVGTLIAFILYLFQVVIPMAQLSNFFATLNTAAGAAEHLDSLLREEVEDPVDDGEAAEAGNALRFAGVRFGYGDGPTVLDGFDLEIPAGSVTALVGPSGSGKTTVLSLLERFYHPTGGQITTGSQPLDQLALEPWRRRIGYVPQEAPLLSGTVRNNLCYGLERPPSDEVIQHALRSARADRFVAELSDGLETEVGERGVKLSGGQRQRLAIARAFLTDPDILMLDEATANLDAESESAVRDALGALMKGRTVVVVAHRLSTVVGADQIAVVEAGRVTGRGRHEELLSSHELYRELVEQQQVSDGVALAPR